jgi:hypothetical protein
MKKWYQSKTIWGVVIAFIGYVLSNIVGVPDLNIPANADYEALSTLVKNVKESQGDISVILGQVMGFIGTGLAIYGRIKAEGKIG